MKKRIFALALALCMMLSVMPTSFAGNGFLTLDNGEQAPSAPSGILTDDSKVAPQSGVLTGASKYYRDGILYNTGSQSGASYSLPSGTTPLADPVDDPVVIDTVTYSGTNTANGYKGGGDTAAPSSRKDVDGLFTSKTVSKKNDSTFTVKLEAYTDGTSGTYTSAVPADIILVLEESAKMAETIYEYTPVDGTDLDTNKTYYVKVDDSYVAVYWCTSRHVLSGVYSVGAWATGFHWFIHWGTVYEPIQSNGKHYYSELSWVNNFNGDTVQFYERKAIETTRQEALKTAAEQFVSDVYNDAAENNVAHRVSVVTFADTAKTTIGLADDIRSNKTAVINSIDTLGSSGGCNVAAGLERAKSIFDTTDGTGRTRVIVLYTDGIPSSAETWDGAAISNAASAIGTAKTLKSSAYGVLIYTVGLGENIDPTLDVDNSELTDANKETDNYRTNAFLHRVSSNFPNATSLTDGGDGGSVSNGYYIGANDTESLKNVFKKVTESFETPTVSLDASTVIKDIVTKYFSLDTTSVKVYTANYSNGAFAERAAWRDVTSSMTVSKADNTVAVSGFNYNSHFVGGSAPQKLIVEFDITVKSGFMGGNNVPTNNAASGVYASTALIENFIYPLVNVTIPEPVVEVEDYQVIYYGETAPAVSDLYTKITPTETDAWKYDFVELTYTVPNGINNDACGTYDFQLNIKPIAAATTSVGTANATTGVDSDVAQVKVHVLKAVLEGRDDTIYLGATTNLNDLIDHSWACDCTTGKVTRDDTDTDPAVDYWFDDTARIVSESEGAYAPADNDCEEITVTCNRGNGSDTFTVHVVKPVITSEDITIYLSNTVDLNGQMKEEGNWVCGHTGSEPLPANNGETRLAPTIDYTFMVGSTPVSTETAYQPLGCTEINVTATVNGKDAPIRKDAAGKDYSTFQIHVLKPAFTVTCTDLWADYDTNVTLANHLNTTVTGWSDTTENHSNIPNPDEIKKPGTFTYTYTVKNSSYEGVTEHKVTENDADFTVELAGFKIGALDCGSRWSAVTVNKVDGENSDHNFTIHTNKFDLTIKKTWNGADVYKQDAIFTVSGGRGPFQVVLPAGQESITVKNLLCGQDYTVTEDSGWTWRWGDDGTKTVTIHEHGVTTDMPTSHTEGATAAETSDENSVSFINTLVNRLWFSFCKLVQNIFGVGSFERRGN